MKPVVVQAEPLEPEPAAWLAQRVDLRSVPHTDPEFLDALADAQGLIVRTYTQVNTGLLERAPALRVVARAGVALENIDLAACRDRGVTVVHTPGANTRAVVEFVLALLLDALRVRSYVTAAEEPEQWQPLRDARMSGRQLSELTLGVLGVGRIGSQVCRAAQALDMTVLGCDLHDVPDPQRWGAEMVSAEALFERADVVSVHIDSRPSNRGFVSSKLIERMKPDAALVNTSRGFVVDTPALASFLRARPEALALIDVHEPEPFEEGYPLLGLPNARLTPHIAAGTKTAKTNMSWVVRDVWRVLQGEAPEWPAKVL